jgi:hypothetical protein
MVDRPARKIAESLAQKQVSEAFRKRVLAALELSKASLFKEYCAKPELQSARFLKLLRARMLAQIGILCLCKDHRNILMWSHYANEHRGFVVAFAALRR